MDRPMFYRYPFPFASFAVQLLDLLQVRAG